MWAVVFDYLCAQNQLMRISVLSITRNDLAGIRRTLASVRALVPCGKVEVEHIVVDSSDSDIAPLVKAACGRDAVYSWTAPRKIYPAMNRALALSTGEVVGFLNGGDVFADAEALCRVADTLERSGADFVLSDVIFTDSKRYYSGKDFTVRSLEAGIAPPHPSFYARRKVYDALGCYDESYTVVGDFELFCRLAKRSDFAGAYICGPFVKMESGGTSQILKNRLGRNTLEKYRALKTNGLKASWLRLYYRFIRIIYSQF